MNVILHYTPTAPNPSTPRSLLFHNLQNAHNSHSYFLFGYSPNLFLSLHRSQRDTDSDSDSDSLSKKNRIVSAIRSYLRSSQTLSLRSPYIPNPNSLSLSTRRSTTTTVENRSKEREFHRFIELQPFSYLR